MARVSIQRNAETTARLELRALERMVSVLCEHAELLSHEVRSQEASSRETELQLEAFEERRAQALEALRIRAGEPYETRITRLEKLVEALDCSRAYFRPEDGETEPSVWAIRLR